MAAQLSTEKQLSLEEECLTEAYQLAGMLCGDVRIAPIVDGYPDFMVDSRDDLKPAPSHFTEFEHPDDFYGLCVITDGFSRFTDYVGNENTTVLTWTDGDGEYQHRQIDGPSHEFGPACKVLERALDGEPMHQIHFTKGLVSPAPWLKNRAPVSATPANDNWTPPGKTGERIRERQAQEAEAKLAPASHAVGTTAVPVKVIRFVDPSSWEGKPIPDREWFIPGLIPSRTVTLLSGDGGLGKSLLAIQIGVAAATGGETLGLKPANSRVVYIGAEDEEDEFKRRIRDIQATKGGRFSDLKGRFILLPLAEVDATLAAPDKSGMMVATSLMTSLEAEVKAFNPGLVVLDTSADLFGGDEIKRSQVRQFVAMLRKMALASNCAVLLLSQPSVSGMTSGTGTSGSTAWNNSVRSRLYLTKPDGADADPDARILTTMKANYGKVGDAIALRWQAGSFVLNDGSTPNPGAILMANKADKVFCELLSRISRQGFKLSPSPSPSYGPKLMSEHKDSQGISKKHFVDAMARLLDAGTVEVMESGPPSRRYKELVLAAENFSGQGGSN